MKKITTILLVILAISNSAKAQSHGFSFEYFSSGKLYTIDLTTATKTIVGSSSSGIGAADFGANDVLYAINSETNQFYQVDTTNGAVTLIGSMMPPLNHLWTGMAYDEVSGIMYGYSAYSVAAGEGSLHTIDVSTGSYSLVGTQTTATSIACIAIDGTGQMYGMNIWGQGAIYSIDKATGSVAYIGDIGQGAAGMGHGMDWNKATQTMYLTTYNSFTFENTLRSVNLTTGATTQIGSPLGNWFGAFAVPGGIALNADFTSDVTEVCSASSVTFTDLSTSATSWSWIFEGGTPTTSTNQNPTIIYNTAGVFDVTLVVSNGTNTDTKYVGDMITVYESPFPMVIGESMVCEDYEYAYSTENNAGSAYAWEVQGGDITSGSGTNEVTVLWTTIGSGTVLVTETTAENCIGISDTLDVMVDECLSLNEVSRGEVMKIYPNPANDFVIVNLESETSGRLEIIITNLMGKAILKSGFDYMAGNNSFKMDVNEYKTGIYFVNVVTSDGSTQITKLIVGSDK